RLANRWSRNERRAERAGFRGVERGAAEATCRAAREARSGATMSDERSARGFEAWSGGTGLLRGAMIAGAAGLGGTVIAVAFSPKQGLPSYLVGFTYWLGIAIGALAWLTVFHAAHARWM